MRFDPNHPEFGQFSDIYADESSQTKHRYLLLGGIVLPTSDVRSYETEIQRARLPELPAGELAWTKVSRSKLPAYIRVVDTFFDNSTQISHLNFHSLFLDTHKLNHKKYNAGSPDIGFNKEVYQLFMMLPRLYANRLFHCYPDRRSTSSSTEELRLILNRGARKKCGRQDWPFRRVNFRDSDRTPLLQVVDVLLGAVAYKLNDHYSHSEASPAKKQLCDHVLQRARVSNPLLGTPRSAHRFTIWPRQLK